MKTPPNPLSAQLRELRRQADLTGAEAALRTGLSHSKVSRLETGKIMPTEDDIAALCKAYKASADVRRDLIKMVKALREAITGARVILHRGGWQMQERIGLIETSATLLRSFSPDTMIGLLQIEAYIETMLASALTGENLERTIAARLNRQAVLQTAREFHFILTDGALRWNVAGHDVQAAQLDHLVEVSKRPNVRLGVIPWTKPTGMPGANAFHLYDSTAAIVGTETATAIINDPRDLQEYEARFAALGSVAVYDDEARDVLQRLAADYRML